MDVLFTTSGPLDVLYEDVLNKGVRVINVLNLDVCIKDVYWTSLLRTSLKDKVAASPFYDCIVQMYASRGPSTRFDLRLALPVCRLKHVFFFPGVTLKKCFKVTFGGSVFQSVL